jgi:RNase P subunit RPR2
MLKKKPSGGEAEVALRVARERIQNLEAETERLKSQKADLERLSTSERKVVLDKEALQIKEETEQFRCDVCTVITFKVTH